MPAGTYDVGDRSHIANGVIIVRDDHVRCARGAGIKKKWLRLPRGNNSTGLAGYRSPREIAARGVFKVLMKEIISWGECSGLPLWSNLSVETTHFSRG